jgi:hypothetical protein
MLRTESRVKWAANPPKLPVKENSPDRQLSTRLMHRSKTVSLFDHLGGAGEE